MEVDGAHRPTVQRTAVTLGLGALAVLAADSAPRAVHVEVRCCAAYVPSTNGTWSRDVDPEDLPGATCSSSSYVLPGGR